MNKNFVIVFLVTLGFLFVFNKKQTHSLPLIPPAIPEKPKKEKEKERPNITVQEPGYLTYEQTVEQLKKWNKEAKDYTEIGVYGKSKENRDLYYFRLTGDLSNHNNPKVLITACIHGNEKTVGAVLLGIMGKLMADPNMLNIVKDRDLYFVPIVCADGFAHDSRHVQGRDPNRDFNSNPSVDEVEALKNFFLKHRFSAYISGHSYGRVYLYPYGDRNETCPDDLQFKNLLDKMGKLSGYTKLQANRNYGRPIFGSDLDWGYKNGAFSIVIEHGTSFNQPDYHAETVRNYESYLLFIREAPTLLNRIYYVPYIE